MIVCKNTPQNKLQWLVAGWNATDQSHNMLNHLVGKDIVSFGRCQIGSGMMQWSFSNNGLVSYKDLDDGKKQLCLALLDELFNRVKRAFGNEDKGRAEAVCTIPSYDYLFLSSDGATVHIAAWGFKLCGQKTFDPLEHYLPVDKRHPVKIAFTDTGRYVPGRPFTIKNAKTDNEYKTGNDGLFTLGEKIEPGRVINITDAITSKPFTITVDEKQEIYLFDITEKRKDTPVVITPPNTPKEQVSEVNPEEIPEKKPEKKPEEKPLTVRIGLHDIDGAPLKNLKVKITTKKGVYDMVTDNDGNVWLPKENFIHRKKVKIKFSYMPINK